METIASEIKDESPYESKFSATDTMRAIFSLLMDEEAGMIGHEARNHCYGWPSSLTSVLDTFSDEELGWLRTETDEGKDKTEDL